MATTTNYGWDTPDDTDLVKDGAAAIRTLGSSVDTTTKALNPSTTEGDIEYRSATANTNTRLGIGTAGQVLTVNSGADAPEWATLAAGSMTLISTTTLTGASVTLSSIPQTYLDLRLVLIDPLPATDGAYVQLQYNGVTTSQYFGTTGVFYSTTPVSAGALTSSMDIAGTTGLDNSVSNTQMIHTILDYTNSATRKCINTYAVTTDPTTTTSHYMGIYPAMYAQTTAISSILIKMNTGNLTSGTALLYGVK
jgi:hypothetical protein